MKKLILISLLASGLFADECNWNINKYMEEGQRLSISMKDKDFPSMKYHLDMAMIYNMEAIIKCDSSYQEKINKDRKNMINMKNMLKGVGY